jgi:hypothetical protein
MVDASESSKEENFWNWFLENEQMLRLSAHTDADREQIFDQVQGALLMVDDNLAFEFGPPEPRREFIVSAGGIKESFPAVIRLQQAQPPLEQWAVTYFRPRREPISTITLDDLTLDSGNVEFSLLSKASDIGLEVFIPGYDDHDARYKQIGYLFLDQALGEYDVAAEVTYLRFFSATEPLKYDRLPFNELPQRFDHLFERLNGLLARPS